MQLTYFDTGKIPHIVEEYFELSFSENNVPFQSTILPLEYTNLTYIEYGNQKSINKNIETQLEGLIISGQFFRSYQFLVNNESKSIGISFHPTALYKLLSTDISKLENKHVSLQKFHKQFFLDIYPLFKSSKNSKSLVKNLNSYFLNKELIIDKNTENVDNAVDIIRKKEGLLNVNEILDDVLISQKSLETQFKKIVGLTPGKYIRKYRFIKLMRRYESHLIDLKDLIYMYNYYDHSHFTKDFKLFMKESPKSYFGKDHKLLNAYLNK